LARETVARPVIVWFRKDLRLDDNRALHAACASGRPVIPLYIREPQEDGTGPLGAAQAWWLHHSLHALDAALKRHGGKLILASGHARNVLADIIKRSGAEAVFWNRRYDPPGIAIDTRLKHEFEKQAIEARSFGGQLLHEPTKLKTASGTSYRVYTPFWRALEEGGEPEAPVDAPERFRFPKQFPASEVLTSWKLLPLKPNWAKSFPEPLKVP